MILLALILSFAMYFSEVSLVEKNRPRQVIIPEDKSISVCPVNISKSESFH